MPYFLPNFALLFSRSLPSAPRTEIPVLPVRVPPGRGTQTQTSKKTMTNPLTTWIESGMEDNDAREKSMVDRVAEASINAQRLVDEKHGPYRGNNWWRNERRSREFDHFYCAGSMYKGKDEAAISSYKAARYYNGEAAKRRDELLAEAAAAEKK